VNHQRHWKTALSIKQTLWCRRDSLNQKWAWKETCYNKRDHLNEKRHQKRTCPLLESKQASRWGWGFLKRTRILSGIQFTRHFIEFAVVETKQFVGSNVNVILTRQTCGQRSSMAAGGKFRALAFYFLIQNWYVFWESKCRGESDLSLCTILGLLKRMPLRSADLRQILRPDTFPNRKSAPRHRILFASFKVVHRPRSDSLLHFHCGNI